MNTDPARWDRVKRLFQSARECPMEERARFLREECGSDHAMMREVESLLAAHQQAGDFAERPALDALVAGSATVTGDATMTGRALEPGLRLGPYQVIEHIGRGGMGEVYRAHDTRLDRTVAIKVLPSHLAGNADLKHRFEREARTLAALSHPHICPVFDVGQHEGVDYLVMEHLDGETLATRLARGALPLAQALRYATEIADALDKAHRKRIVHRDLKPGNVMLTKGGAKLLDFGLAKQQVVATSGALGADTTVSEPSTAPGTILGTLTYMAPEQVEGKVADARSDIFAFGAVLYEMVTGVRAFDGDTPASVIGAILEREPVPLLHRQPAAPSALDRLMKACLAKDPDQRWQGAGDLVRELKWITEERSHAVPAAAAQRFSWRVAIAGLAVGGLMMTGILVLVGLPGQEREMRSIVRSVIAGSGDRPGSGLTLVRDIAIARDGSRMVYGPSTLAGPLRVHAFDRLDAEPLQGTDGASSPTFSPDGRFVLFFDRRDFAMKRVSILGGPPTTIATAGGLLAGLSWGPDDMIVFAKESGEGLFRVPVAGSPPPEQLTTVEEAERGTTHRWPDVLPNGRGVLFTVWRGSVESSHIAVMSFETREVRYLLPGGSHPLYAPTGHIVYAAGDELRAVGFDPERLVLTGGDPTAAVENVQIDASGSAQFDLAANGSLVYISQNLTGVSRSLVWVDRNGREELLDMPSRAYQLVRLSPDGSRIAAGTAQQGNSQVSASNRARTVLTRLPKPQGARDTYFPDWTPDGLRVVYQSGPGRLFWTLADGTGEVERLLTIEGMTILSPSGWTPDRKTLLISYGNAANIRVGSVSMEGTGKGDRPWTPLLDRDGKASAPDVSPIGEWISYQSFDSGRYEVYIERFPELGGRQVVSGEAGGFNPVWSRSGDELFYRRLGDGAMMAVRVRTTPTLTIDPPVMLFPSQRYRPVSSPSPGQGAGRFWDVAPNGRFLMIKEPPNVDGTEGLNQTGSIIHVQNWFQELGRLVPAR